MSHIVKLEGKYSLESTDPRESEIRAHLRRVHNCLLSELSWECMTYLLCIKWFVCLFTLEKVCLHWKNSPFYGVFEH